MSAPQQPALEAIAFQLMAALERYEACADRMMKEGPEMDVYREASQEIERVRVYCASLPQLSVQWVEVLIAHSELVHRLWQERFRPGESRLDTVEQCAARHADCLAALRARCRRCYLRPLRGISGGRPRQNGRAVS